ncbi:tyrosine-type recombinase/integrase [bacterium]|nr:tyrosine-type recombinase/integrase [bacterium]
MSSVFKKGDYWVYQYRVNGKQKVIHLGKLPNKTIAKQKKAELDSIYVLNKYIPIEKVPISKILYDYFNVLKLRCSNDLHITNTKYRINNFIQEENICYLSQITRRKAETFILRRKKEDLADLTINHYLIAIKGLINWAIKNNYLLSNPISGIKLAKAQKRPPNFLTKPQITELLEKVEKYCPMKYMIYISLSTGIRPNELNIMDWEDWDFNRNILTIPKSKNRYWRTISFNNNLTDRIKPIIKNKGKCFNYSIIPPRRQFAKLQKELSFDFIYYDLRSTYACQLLLDNVNPENVRQLLGHRSLNTTMRYVRALGNYQNEAVKNFNIFSA